MSRFFYVAQYLNHWQKNKSVKVDKVHICNVMEIDDHRISHMSGHLIDFTWLRQFDITKVDFFLIICHLIYLNFLVNLFNQISQSIFSINLY